jgi:hypothetical protein
MSRHEFDSLLQAKEFADLQRLDGLKTEIQHIGTKYIVVVWEAADV